jgi:DNA repair protein RecO (recombination protein O)
MMNEMRDEERFSPIQHSSFSIQHFSPIPNAAYNANMPLVADHCICLRKVEFSETSQILTLLGVERGIVRVMAKGAHRRTKAGASKFDGGIDLLDSGHAVFTDDSSKDLATLTEWKLTDGHLDLRRNLRGLYLGLYATELITLLIEEHDPHPEIFRLLAQCLADLGTNRRVENYLAFQLDLLREAGYLPEFKACINCGAAPSGPTCFFAPSRGGIVCANCQSAIPDRFSLDVRLLRIIQGMVQPPTTPTRRLPQLTRHQTDPMNSLLARHVEHTLSRRLRMTGYVLPTAPPHRTVVRDRAVPSPHQN